MMEDDGRVVSNFIVQALRNENLTVYGDGSQTRSFCYVEDLIKGMIKVMEGDIPGPINLGNINEISIKELAFRIKEKINKDLKIIHKDIPQDDPVRRKPSLSLANEKYNWSPVIDLEEGLENTIKYFKENLDQPL
tara:strand:- start:249 stop:653 length:405 start_codon:yes stop_codon:yes gene_type:complete